MASSPRYPLRPSPPTQDRLLRTTDVAQYALPYPVVSENPTAENEANLVIHPPATRPSRKMTATQSVKLQEPNVPRRKHGEKKPPAKEPVPAHAKLLVSREEAAQLLSISVRGIDYLLATRRLPFRRIGGRVLISVADLRKYASGDHPERIVA